MHNDLILHAFGWLTSISFDSVHQIIFNSLHHYERYSDFKFTCTCWWEVEENPETSAQFKHDVTAEMLSGLLLLVHIHFSIALTIQWITCSTGLNSGLFVCVYIYIYKRICCDLIYRGGNVMTHARLASQRENPFSLVGSIEGRVSALHEILSIYIRRSTFFFLRLLRGFVYIAVPSAILIASAYSKRILHIYLCMMNRAGEDRLLYGYC